MPEVTNAVKQQIINEYLQTPQGRRKLAASMIQPLRRRRDYRSMARKAFLVEQLPDGALPVYDKDPDVTAWVIGEEGQNILSISKPQRVLIPLFEIASNPEIPITQARERRFDVVQRSIDLGRAEIQAEEDGRAFAIMDAVATDPAVPNADLTCTAPISVVKFADAFARIERWDLRVAYIFMNATDYADMRKFNRDILDIESQAVLLKTGLMATLWGAKVIITRKVPIGYTYFTAEPEFFGRIPVRTELTVLSADDPKARTIGFSIFEHLGLGVHNPYGLQRVRVTSRTP